MTKKRKEHIMTQSFIYIAAALVVVCLIGWIVILYVQKYQEEKNRENEFLMRYSAALNDVTHHLGQFEEMKSFEEQLSCLERVTNDLVQLKAYMEIHINLLTPKGVTSKVNTSGWHEAETVIGLINNGGMIDSYQIESFRADGVISEAEVSALQLLKEEALKLQNDMCMSDDAGINYKLSSVEVYQRLTEMMQKVKAQLLPV